MLLESPYLLYDPYTSSEKKESNERKGMKGGIKGGGGGVKGGGEMRNGEM